MAQRPAAIHLRVELGDFPTDGVLEQVEDVLARMNATLDARDELDGVPRHELVLLGEEADSGLPEVAEPGPTWLLLLGCGAAGGLHFAATADAQPASLAVLRKSWRSLVDADPVAEARVLGTTPDKPAPTSVDERQRLQRLFAEREKEMHGSIPEWSPSMWRVPVRQRTADVWRVFGASVTGTRHLDRGGVCDDACGWMRIEEGIAFAVADGAGFAARAEEGSRLAILGAFDTLSLPAEPEGWETALKAAAAGARSRIEGEEGPAADFSTTLLLAVWTPAYLAVLQIGDGVVVARLADGSLRSVTQPDHGEHYNETVFVTSEESEARTQFHLLPARDITDIALLSDGLQGLALELAAHRPVPGFFAPFFKMARADGAEMHASSERLARFLGSARVCARTDDDKTLVVASRVDA